VVFRRDSKVDAFQKQISALRHQLGGESDAYAFSDHDRGPAPIGEGAFRGDLPDLDLIRAEAAYPSARDQEHRAYDEPQQAMESPVPALDMNTSVISHSTSWNGTLESSGSLHVYGRVEGALTAKLDIFIAEEAVVDAVVSAANVTIAGSVRGSIQCTAKFEVLPRGRVAGDVHAPAIVVHEGAVLACDVAMTSSNGTSTTSHSSSARSVRSGA
jgi:cytoskeletal protein CcmA (bactofilin family)